MPRSPRTKNIKRQQLHRMVCSFFLSILSLVTTASILNSRRVPLQDDSEDLHRKQIAATQDLFNDAAAVSVGETVAIVVTVVVCIGFLAVVGAVIYCCCCLPCYVLGSRSRNRGEVYQRTQATPSPRAAYPQQVMGPQGQQPPLGPNQPPGFYPPPPPPAIQQIPMQSFPPSLPPPYPGPPAGSLQPHQDPYNYMEKQGCKNSE